MYSSSCFQYMHPYTLIIVVINNIWRVQLDVRMYLAINILCIHANLFIYSVTAQPRLPTNVRATVLTPRSVEVTWTVSSSSDVTGYLISYATIAEYTSGDSVLVSGNSTTRGILMNLEEGTFYTITVRANSNNGMSANSNAVSVTTYTDGK